MQLQNWEIALDALDIIVPTSTGATLVPASALPTRSGGAYEYGTNKVAVNYGNLLVGSFTRNSTNTSSSSYGSWDTNVLPNPPATPFCPGLGVGTQINAFNRNDGYAPYSEQWNVNLQRELPWQIFLQAAWVGNREVHLPSQLNRINQLNPSYLSLGPKLGLSFADGTAHAAGFALPYPTFVNDFGGSATVAIERCPTLMQAHVDRARTLIKQSKPDKALPDLLVAEKDSPKEPSIHFLLSTIYRAQGKTSDAQQELRTYGALQREASQATADRGSDAIAIKNAAH